MNFKMKRLFMLILVSIYIQMLFSSTDVTDEDYRNDLKQRLLANFTKNITPINTENEKSQDYDRKKLTILGKLFIGTEISKLEIYPFFNAKERASLRLLSKLFYKNFDDLHLNPHKLLYSILNETERQLNDKLMDNANKSYFLKKEDDPRERMHTCEHFVKGFKLKENHSVVSNLKLPTYGPQNFTLDMNVGNGSVRIQDSDLLNEQVTDPQVGDWIAITNDLTVSKIIGDINMHVTEDQLLEGSKYRRDFYVKQVETDDNGSKRMIIGHTSISWDDIPVDTEPTVGDYWISSDIFKSITKVKRISKGLEIVKDSDGIKVKFYDLLRISTMGQSHTNTRSVTKTDLNSVIVKFCPEENKVIVLIDDMVFGCIENPERLELIMNPHEHNFYLKFL